jgi:hypothetical protein
MEESEWRGRRRGKRGAEAAAEVNILLQGQGRRKRVCSLRSFPLLFALVVGRFFSLFWVYMGSFFGFLRGFGTRF